MFDFLLYVFVNLIFAVRKIFRLKLELDNKHNNKHNKFQILLIKYFSSNHERRMLLNRRALSTKSRKNKCISMDQKVDYDFLTHKTIILYKKKLLLVYVGDSLIEYLSRVKINCDNYRNALAFWLGPKTRLGLTQEKEMHFIHTSIKTFVNKYTFNKDYDEVVLVWSSGSIDVRCSIFELELRGLIISESNFLELYKNTTRSLIENLIIPLSKSINSKKVVILSELDSPLGGQLPQNIKELKEIKARDLYPSLGRPAYRKNWREKLNLISEEQAKQYKLSYFDLNPYILTDDKSGSTQFDGVHISDPIAIDLINKKIINLP